MASAMSFGDANAGFQAGIIHGSVNTAFHLPPGRLPEVLGFELMLRVACLRAIRDPTTPVDRDSV